jgi:hypothetical protein
VSDWIYGFFLAVVPPIIALVIAILIFGDAIVFSIMKI